VCMRACVRASVLVYILDIKSIYLHTYQNTHKLDHKVIGNVCLCARVYKNTGVYTRICVYVCGYETIYIRVHSFRTSANKLHPHRT
jgi:hypothetical protein